MANTATTQTILDGPRYVTMLLTGTLDTSNEAANIKVDVSALDPAPVEVSVEKIIYSISANLKVLLQWAATTDVVFAALAGQGELCAEAAGNIINNAGAGKTGDIELQTLGWAATLIESYTILLVMRKKGV